MQNKKQKLLIEYMLSSPETYALCRSLIKADYFDPNFRSTIEFVSDYYDKYSALPTRPQLEAETSETYDTHELDRATAKYCALEIEQFCQQKALESAVIAAAKFVKTHEPGKIKSLIEEAMSVSLTKDLGLDYFADPQTRLEEQSKQPLRMSVGIKGIDDMLGGGLARTEILMVSANSGGGKSILMANIGLNMSRQSILPHSDVKLNVLYISLELSEPLIAQRVDMMLTGVPTALTSSRHEEVAYAIKNQGVGRGKFIIKRMPVGTNANTIRAYLKEFELTYGFVPDVLIVDYLDLMGTNTKVSADNIFEKDKQAAEQLRDVLTDFNMYGITASQQNRGAVEASHLNHSHIAGGISKVNTVDWWISITLNSTMKAAGQVGLTMLKSRSSAGEGMVKLLAWNNSRLMITDPETPFSEEDTIDAVNNARSTNDKQTKKTSSAKTQPQRFSREDAKRFFPGTDNPPFSQ